MSTSPFGAAGFGFPFFDPARMGAFANPWFAGAAPPRPAAADPFAWWTQAAQPTPPPSAFDPSALAGQWMTQMQQLAAQFGGRDAQAGDIARAWRVLIGENPFAQAAASSAFMPPAFSAMGMGGTRGPFDMPAFGFAREHQERAQAFAKTLADFQQAAQGFNAIVAEAGQDAFARFESLLQGRSNDGKPVETARALFDLWIDAAEDAYADIALGERFQKAFGDYVNAQMRVRAAMQKEVELACAQWGIPGRAEVDGAHRKIAELERELRRLRDMIAVASAGAGTSATDATRPADAAPGRARPTPAGKGGARAKPSASTGKPSRGDKR